TAIKNGNFFVGFDVLGDSRGFDFTAQAAGQTAQMGTEVPSALQTRNMIAIGAKVHAAVPVSARIVLLQNGEKVEEVSNARELWYDATAPGEYRIEVYREGLGPDFDNMPWILSNPIYIR